MPVPAKAQVQRSYFSHIGTLLRVASSKLVAMPSAPGRAEAVRRLRQQLLWLTIIGAVVIVALMFSFDATEISMMPKRGVPDLWPARVLTDFGKDEYVLWCLVAGLVAIAVLGPLL